MEESEELLKQFVQDALLLKSSGDGTTLYDQYVETTLLPALLCSHVACTTTTLCVYVLLQTGARVASIEGDL